MKVHLPSDKLTQEQLKQRNGKMEEYSLRKPMSWARLQELPLDLRKEYIITLRDEYHATQTMICDMLGTSTRTFRKWCNSWGIMFPGTGGHKSEAEKLKWLHFLQGTDTREANEPDEPELLPDPDTVVPLDLVPRTGTMSFTGPAGAALRKAYGLLGETCCTALTISWDMEETDLV